MNDLIYRRGEKGLILAEAIISAAKPIVIQFGPTERASAYLGLGNPVFLNSVAGSFVRADQASIYLNHPQYPIDGMDAAEVIGHEVGLHNVLGIGNHAVIFELFENDMRQAAGWSQPRVWHTQDGTIAEARQLENYASDLAAGQALIDAFYRNHPRP